MSTSLNEFIASQQTKIGYVLHTTGRQSYAVSNGCYQEKKISKTTNSIFLSDYLGQILAMGNPKSGNHYDLNGIESILTEF